MVKIEKIPPPQDGYVCPACAAEGNAKPQPLSAFYVINAPEYRGPKGAWRKYKNNKKRSPLCKRHTNAANTAWQRTHLDPHSPFYKPDYTAKVKAAKNRYAKAKLNPASERYDPDLHERQKAAKRKNAARRRGHQPE